MRAWVLFLILSFWYCPAWAETFDKRLGESATAFASRNIPHNGSLAHPVIETSVWQLPAPAIITFFGHPPAPEDITEATISAFVFAPISPAKYERILVDNYGAEGGDPKIESVFFAGTDKTNDKKLIVIVSWEQNHATVQGTLYETFIYSFPKTTPYPRKLPYLKALSDQLSGGCDCRRPLEEGPSTKAKYKTAADVKRALKKLDQP